MRVCSRCGQIAQPNEQYCSRCGGTKFTVSEQTRTPNNVQQRQARPIPQPQQGVQGTQAGVRPQVQRQPQQINNGSNGNAVKPQNQRPIQPNNMVRPQQPVQRQPMQTEVAQAVNIAQEQNVNAYPEQQKKTKKPLFSKKQPQNIEQTQQTSTYNENSEFMSVKDWIITMLMLIIPIWNIVYIIQQIKNPMTGLIKKNFLKAYVIYAIAGIVISILISVILTVSGILYLLV